MPRLILHAVLLLVLAVPRVALAACPDHPIRIIGRLNAELVSIIREPEIIKTFIEPFGTSPEEFGKNLRADITRWSGLVKKRGIRTQ